MVEENIKKVMTNLAKAFVGESQARNRYTFYAKIAAKEGFQGVSEIFLLTAENEKEHAKWLMRMLNAIKDKHGFESNKLENIEGEVPLTLGSTVDNLKAAIEGENFEYTEMYPSFAETAEKEGMQDIADRLRAIAKAEEHHEERFKKILKEIEGNTIFKKSDKVYWVCGKCGYIHEGEEPPEKCPSCDHPKGYFEIKCEEY